MNKKITFVMLAVLLVLLTVHSALAVISITSTPITTATVGQQYSYQVVVSNPTGDALIYTLPQAPQGMQISNNGLITWTPTSAGAFNVNVTVSSDAGSTASQAYVLTVNALAATLTAEAVELGSQTQKRDEQILNSPWTIKNTGSYAITINSIQHTVVSTRYNMTITLAQQTIQPGQQVNALITINVPSNEDAGRKRIGQVNIAASAADGTQISLAKDVYLTVENNLVINEIEVIVGGKKDTLTSSGTVDEEAEFDDEITITIEIENTYSDDNSDTEIRDIELELRSSDLDVADGLDDSLSGLDAGDRDDDMTVSFTLDPEDIDPEDAPFDIDVTITGTTRDGAKHGETWTITLDMDVESRDLNIISATANPSTLSLCSDNRRIRVDTEVRNMGLRDLDTAMLRFDIDGQNVGALIRDIELDQGDKETFIANLDLPRTIAPGTYYVDIKAYPTTSTSSTTDDEAVIITVLECQTQTVTQNTTNNNNNNNQNNTITSPVIQGTPVSSTTGKSVLGNETVYIAILALLVVLMFVAVIFLVFRMTKQ